MKYFLSSQFCLQYHKGSKSDPTKMMSHPSGQRPKLLYRMLDAHVDNKEALWGLLIKH